MIKLLTTEQSELLINHTDISSVYACRGSIGIFPCYTVIKMKSGDRHEVSASVECINNLIEKEMKGMNL